MSKSIYLIDPLSDFPNYHGGDVSAAQGFPFAKIASLALPTVAALAPDDFEITLCDEQISPVDLDHPADFVGITGKGGQVGRMIELGRAFRERGKIVIMGGPYASLVPERVRPFCDILVRGEIEAIASQFFTDLRTGDWQTEYVGGQPDLRLSPVPRWDLYPADRALAGCVQTSRGCPFECEFCDVIVYAGRKQRHKSAEQILAELDVLYNQGYTHVFLADDNFTVYRRQAKELLIALRDWNQRQPEGQITFTTQLSIDIAGDDDILQLCAEAGLISVFVGIETPNEASLKETKKRQNVGIDLIEQINHLLDYSMGVIGGMIVGFDSDDLDIFERQYEFAMQTPIPIFTLGALMAPEATPLYERMQNSNRLWTDDNQTATAWPPWSTNIVPKQMSREELFAGIRWLGNRLYHPPAFGQRILQFTERYKEPTLSLLGLRGSARHVSKDHLKSIQRLFSLGPDEEKMLLQAFEACANKPVTKKIVLQMLFYYAQIRHMYNQGQFWEPHLLQQSAPDFTGISTTQSIALVN